MHAEKAQKRIQGTKRHKRHKKYKNATNKLGKVHAATRTKSSLVGPVKKLNCLNNLLRFFVLVKSYREKKSLKLP